MYSLLLKINTFFFLMTLRFTVAVVLLTEHGRVFPRLRWKKIAPYLAGDLTRKIKAELMLTATNSTFYLSRHFNSHACFVQTWSPVTVPPHKSAVILFFKSKTKLRSKLEASPCIIRILLPHSWVVKRAHNRTTLMKELYSWLNEDSSFSNPHFQFQNLV